MEFGIIEKENGIFCANCKALVSKDGFYTQKYCSNCGAPLKPTSAKEHMDLIKQEQLRVISAIKKALKTYDIDKILSDLTEELTQKS